MKIVAVHGFLGLASDWDPVFPQDKREFELEVVDLWSDLKTLGSSATLRNWSELFIDRLEKSESKPVVVGYSMGGRLAMMAMALNPQAFSGAVIVSANPGLLSEDEKRKRLASDFKWCDRFLNEEWSSLMKAWNSQPVLASPRKPATDSIKLERNEADFDRRLLAQALDVWSVARQPDVSVGLKTFSSPLLFVAGQEDAKYATLAKSLAENGPKTHSHRVIEGAGHRVPWDAPSAFREAVSSLARP